MMRVSQVDLEQGRVSISILPALVVLAVVPLVPPVSLSVPRLTTMIAFSICTLDLVIFLVGIRGLVVGLMNVLRLMIVLVCVVELAISLVFVVRAIISMRIVVVVQMLVLLSGVLDMNRSNTRLYVLGSLSDRLLEFRQHQLLTIVQRGSIRDVERVDETKHRFENGAEDRNLGDCREDIWQGPFLDRAGLMAEGQGIELNGNCGSNISDSVADSSLKLRDDLLLKVGQRGSGIRPKSNSREEIRDRIESGTQESKRVYKLAVLKRPRRKRRKWEVGRKLCDDVASSAIKRVMELIKDRLLSFGKGDTIGDGVHADGPEEVRNRPKDPSKRRCIVEGLDVDDFVPPNT